MMVTRRSSSSEVSSPARLFRSTSAFLQTRLAIQLCQHIASALGVVRRNGRYPQNRHDSGAYGVHTVATTNTLDLTEGMISPQVPPNSRRTKYSRQGVDDLLLAVNVGVEQTQNVVEVALKPQLAFPFQSIFAQCIRQVLHASYAIRSS